MNRPYGVKIDEKRWEIIEASSGSQLVPIKDYKLINKETKDCYSFEKIIGLEQVAEDEFLVYKPYISPVLFTVIRYKLHDLNSDRIFKVNFRNLKGITDDIILFLNDNNVCESIYSINKNEVLEESKWLEGKIVDIRKTDDKNTVLYVEDEVCSNKLGTKKTCFTVEPKTFQPNSECYSEFRDSFISVNTKDDIERIISEDRENINNIEKMLISKNEKVKERILVRKMN